MRRTWLTFIALLVCLLMALSCGCVSFDLHRKTTYAIPCPQMPDGSVAVSSGIVEDVSEVLVVVVQADQPLLEAVKQNGQWGPFIYVTETVWFSFGSSQRILPVIENCKDKE